MILDIDKVWLGIGLFGQALFSARFVLQWLSSERMKKSVIPDAFWYFSIGGGLTLLAYAIHRRDPVFIIGQASGLLIYLRNVQFVRRQRRPSAADASPAPGANTSAGAWGDSTGTVATAASATVATAAAAGVATGPVHAGMEAAPRG